MSNVLPTCSLGSFSVPFSCPLRGEGRTSKIGPIQVEGEALLSFLQLNLLTVFLTKFLQQPKRGHRLTFNYQQNEVFPRLAMVAVILTIKLVEI